MKIKKSTKNNQKNYYNGVKIPLYLNFENYDFKVSNITFDTLEYVFKKSITINELEVLKFIKKFLEKLNNNFNIKINYLYGKNSIEIYENGYVILNLNKFVFKNEFKDFESLLRFVGKKVFEFEKISKINKIDFEMDIPF